MQIIFTNLINTINNNRFLSILVTAILIFLGIFAVIYIIKLLSNIRHYIVNKSNSFYLNNLKLQNNGPTTLTMSERVELTNSILDLITFILVIASLVQFVEMFLKKTSPAIYKAMGVYLPLITTNCAVLGVALDNISAGYNFVEAVVAGLAVSVGFTVVIYIFATIREKLEIADVPESFKGVPIALITVGIMACAIAGIAGLV